MNVLQRQSLAKALGMNIADMDKMVRKEKEAVTLTGEMAKQDISKIIPDEAMSEMAVTFAKMKADLMVLAADIGPDLMETFQDLAKPVMGLLKTFVGWVSKIQESIGFTNILKGVMWGMFAKSVANLAIQVGIAYAKGAGSLGPGALFALAAAPVAIAALVGGIVGYAKSAGDVVSPAAGRTMVSTKEGELLKLSPNDDFVAGPGIAGAVAGGTAGGQSNAAVVAENRQMRKELVQLRNDMAGYFGIGGSANREIGTRAGDAAVAAID